jgi:hypothetical protein
MSIFLSRLSQKQKRILLVISSFLIVASLIVGLTEYRLKNLRTELTVRIEEQQARLIQTANAAAQNGAGMLAPALINDCPVAERTKFETLLGRLDDGLPPTELFELDRLFGRCGAFYAERKSVIVAQLKREVEVYESYVAQLYTLKTVPTEKKYQLEEWNELVLIESNRAVLLMKLVSLQEAIIGALLEGNTPASESVKAILVEVATTQEALIRSNAEVITVQEVLNTK